MKKNPDVTFTQALFGGICLLLTLVGFILISYLFLWVAILGFVIFAVLWIKARFLPETAAPNQQSDKKQRTPITIDQHDDES